MSFIPMDFRSVKRTILETDSCDTLPLAPSTLAIAAAKSPEFPDGAPGSDRLRVSDCADKLEVHRPKLA